LAELFIGLAIATEVKVMVKKDKWKSVSCYFDQATNR